MSILKLLAYSLLAIALLRFAVVLINSLWGSRLGRQADGNSGMVSLLIPARNEEANIGQLLSDISVLKYPELEVLVYDDESTDNTRAIIESWKKKIPGLQLLQGLTLPPGWLGKNFACHQLARQAKGSYLLFLDADVRLKNDLLERALHHLRKHRLHLLSLFPKQVVLTPAEKYSVPLINWILLSLLPLFLVRKCKWKVFSAANGQFMLFHAQSYHRLQPHAMVRDHVVEDIALARMYKYLHLKVDVRMSNSDLNCRMYRDYPSAFEGFSKFILQLFGSNRMAALLFALYSNTAALIVFWTGGYTLGFLFLVLVVLSRILTALMSKLPLGVYLWYLIPQQLFLLRIVTRMALFPDKTPLTWKERPVTPS